MAAPRGAPCELFADGVRAVLGTWPVLQIAVENGFGGAFSQQKAEWMVDAVQEYFSKNVDLQRLEVEDFLAEVLNNEFDTVVEDGSLPEVALQLCELFNQCSRGQLEEVKGRIAQLELKRSSVGRGKVVAARSAGDEEEEESGEEEAAAEAMDCDGAAATVMPAHSSAPWPRTQPRTQTQTQTQPQEPGEDGWTMVGKKKK
ncbi:pre-rRNA-processing protein TSR2 homolog [Polyodon spathula]|uniref:pre-rRNA-processing protein TSR2 homolog n=1 Tax=Polyodon spathula TaxID=7913 RepID=UPI001B7E2093|nr:pre-rRNA-processing protein TSR2 homolog [Polyodon spathula]